MYNKTQLIYTHSQKIFPDFLCPPKQKPLSPPLCKQCSEDDPELFYATNHGRCKPCVKIVTAARRRGDDLSQYGMERTRRTASTRAGAAPFAKTKDPYEHHCKQCGTTAVEDFYDGAYSICRKCKTRQHMERYNEDPDFNTKQKRQTKQWQIDNIFQVRFLASQSRAVSKQISFTITTEIVEQLWESQSGICYHSGLPMSLVPGDDMVVSIDRLDSARGYDRDNIVLCGSIINYMKQASTIKRFVELAEAITKHNK